MSEALSTLLMSTTHVKRYSFLILNNLLTDKSIGILTRESCLYLTPTTETFRPTAPPYLLLSVSNHSLLHTGRATEERPDSFTTTTQRSMQAPSSPRGPVHKYFLSNRERHPLTGWWWAEGIMTAFPSLGCPRGGVIIEV